MEDFLARNLVISKSVIIILKEILEKINDTNESNTDVLKELFKKYRENQQYLESIREEIENYYNEYYCQDGEELIHDILQDQISQESYQILEEIVLDFYKYIGLGNSLYYILIDR